MPVIREKIVTRTIYLEKKGREIKDARRQAPAPLPGLEESALANGNSERRRGQESFFTRVNLTDFRPPDELKIRIISRRNSYEK